MTKINRLLVANRGEIACRIMRTARQLGIQSVAVYSDADSEAVHVRTADVAVNIGPAPASESYLVIDAIIAAARETGSDAIHPGYGFLSENAAFARACEQAGIIFVGPTGQAIELMGDKARAKRAMLKAGVPCVPGYQGEDQDDATLADEAKRIGFPLMIKAAAGGGGRGMRLVNEAGQLATAIETARSEAINAFGNGELILEKAIIEPRHVEVQVFGDQTGNIVYLGERDCSVQRRHQKVIEEAPCPVMTPDLREQMGQAAVQAAAAVSYVGAGTVEFLLAADASFYFLEMNTRLQVEHPVTEAITGLDLVALQLAVAAGKPLGFRQADVNLQGHAIEVRLYAEDPCNDFLPSTGPVRCWQAPAGDGVRVDAGIESGGEVSPYYDPMLAKIIAWGADREQARQRLVNALSASFLSGPASNRDFLIDALERPGFIKGQATTAFIAQEYPGGFSNPPTPADYLLAALLQVTLRNRAAVSRSTGVNRELLNWSSDGSMTSVLVYRDGEYNRTLVVAALEADTYRVSDDTGEIAEFKVLDLTEFHMTSRHQGETSSVMYFDHGDDRRLCLATPRLQFTVADIAAGEAAAGNEGDGRITSPMHGRLLDVFVGEGEAVEAGQRIAVMEAMKMQHEILAGISGTVTVVHAEPATQVSAGQLLLEIEPTDT